MWTCQDHYDAWACFLDVWTTTQYISVFRQWRTSPCLCCHISWYVHMMPWWSIMRHVSYSSSYQPILSRLFTRIFPLGPDIIVTPKYYSLGGIFIGYIFIRVAHHPSFCFHHSYYHHHMAIWCHFCYGDWYVTSILRLPNDDDDDDQF